jgi:hypothetical protein
MKRILFYIIILISVKGYAQNLVPNPSFETYTSCPTGGGAQVPVPWYTPNGSTPDYFNSCATGANYSVPSNMFGFQNAHMGNAYVGMIVYVTFTTNAGEYIQVQLLDTLIANAVYCVSFYVSPADLAQWGCNKIGCYFSSTPVSACGSCQMPYIPQVESTSMISDTSAWVKVSGIFTAIGDEQYLTIGNFRLTANTDTTTINSSVNNPEAYFYIDDISVMLCSDTSISVKEINDKEFKISLYPNPSNSNFLLKYTLKQDDVGAIRIYDLTGKLVEEYGLNTNRNELQLNTNLNNGVYLYQVIVNERIVKSNKLVIIK